MWFRGKASNAYIVNNQYVKTYRRIDRPASHYYSCYYDSHYYDDIVVIYFTLNIPTLSWQRYSGVGHSREGWALQGDSGVGHYRETRGHSGLGHFRETLGLGTPGMTLVGHSRRTLG